MTLFLLFKNWDTPRMPAYMIWNILFSYLWIADVALATAKDSGVFGKSTP